VEARQRPPRRAVPVRPGSRSGQNASPGGPARVVGLYSDAPAVKMGPGAACRLCLVRPRARGGDVGLHPGELRDVNAGPPGEGVRYQRRTWRGSFRLTSAVEPGGGGQTLRDNAAPVNPGSARAIKDCHLATRSAGLLALMLFFFFCRLASRRPSLRDDTTTVRPVSAPPVDSATNPNYRI